ncbi:MAG: hypothetical protein NZ552_03750, partial [Planctomycetes bacterium]|nr:hypothetical protein [Planctomycetota bacterium]
MERIAVALETLVQRAATPLPVEEPRPRSPGSVVPLRVSPPPAAANGRPRAAAGAGSSGSGADPQLVAPRLAEFLAARQIRISHLPMPMPAEQTLNALAVFMAERYGAIAGTLAKMKRAINQ